MKSGIACTLAVLILLSSCRKEPESDRVDIPDQDFLAALIDFGVDQDGNGKISNEEALGVKSLFLELPFYDSKGIEAFINLETLDCSGGKLRHLDVSKNTQLRHLFCSNNELTELDVSSNLLLNTLECAHNQLSQLAVSKNINLNSLQCQENQLSQLITTANTNLYSLYCNGNQLQWLDIWNNEHLYDLRCGHNKLLFLNLSAQTSLQFFHCGGNPISQLDLSENTYLLEIGLGQMSALHEVCVWTKPFPPEQVTIDTIGSPNVFFTVNCTTGT